MGTIIKRKNSYQVQISNYKNGVQNRVTRTFKTKAEAKHWEREMELMKGNGIQMTEWKTLFPQFYSDWVYFVKKDEVRESTFKNYRRSIKVINQLFNNIKLRDLNDIIVQKKIDEYSKTRSKRTVNDLLIKIKSSLKYAHARGYIAIDFTNNLKAKGAILENRNKVLSIKEYKKLKEYLLNNTGDEINIFIYVVLVTGLRRGEALGLRPEHIFPNHIQVTESISPESSDRMLKTKSSEREVVIDKETYDLIQSVKVKEDGYIFERNFTPSTDLAKVLKQLNITKTTIQGLRRTHASIAYAGLQEVLHIADRLGHESTDTTHSYYLELTPETKAREDQKLLDYFATL